MRIRKHLVLALAALFMMSGLAQAASLPDFSELAAKCGPAVVNIGTERTAQGGGPEEFFGEMFRNMPPGFGQFFDQFGMGGPRGGKRMPQKKQKSLGSGFIISADGYIVTNNHVVADADVIHVTLDESNGKATPLEAKLIGADEETDLALLKVEAKKDLPFLKFGNSDALKVGEWLMAIGNPFGLDHTVTSGILSAKGRNIRSGPFDNFLQTDCSINPGNSGGPLLNMDGDVIGINTAIIASGQGIGFAIPSNMAANIIEQIKSGKKVSRGWIGVTIQDVDEAMAKAIGMEMPHGALVASTLDGEPAARAGIEAGDVIVSVDGENIADSSALLRAIAAKKPGNVVKLGIWRNGKEQTMSVTLGERQNAQSATPGKEDRKQDEGLLGLTVRALKPEERQEMDIADKEGILVLDVNPDKAAAEADIRPGDVILRADRTPVNTPEALSKIVKEVGVKRGAIMLQVLRRGDTLFKAITLEKK
ncbi:MAG TPA: DegQ family serine endoprotease [Candidatus Desulfovibrio intestinavium]|uniref:Probable periplasmic serine endoprotease DegP-like n=1 Tax=Candidatus Desulfovibrio intestinavium TaxID=2838534 RepID=A0A9D2KSA9_9BACT|nr:DegQ family serine endoprotease [Candidatus Desulfovibrio intestinavium]